MYINLPNNKTFAWAPRSGSTAILRALTTTFFPEQLAIPVSTPNGVDPDPHCLCPSASSPTDGNELVILLRDPVERFRSACARTNKTPEEGLASLSSNAHFTPYSEWFYRLPSTFTAFSFETEFDACTTYLGVGVIPQENEGQNKPTLNSEQLTAVQEAYASDILFVAKAFLEPPAPPAPVIPTQAECIALGESHVLNAGITGFRLAALQNRLLETKEANALADHPKMVALYTWLKTVEAMAIAGATEFPPAPHTFEEVVIE